MEEKIRNTGIDAIGAVPWGTHICQFYETKQDLIDILVPYFKTGLQNNESCICITSEPLFEEETRQAIGKTVPDFTRCLEAGQIEIIPHNEWYLKDGVFDGKRVLNAWIEKLNQALSKGYDGMRVAGNMAWLEENDWVRLIDYEKDVNSVVGRHNMLSICAYPFDICRAGTFIDVVANHQFTLIKRVGDWVLEGYGYKRVEEELIRLSSAVSMSSDGITNI